MKIRAFAWVAAVLGMAIGSAFAQPPGQNPKGQSSPRFADLHGSTAVGPVKSGGPVEVPYITWGGDVATFWANGGLTTRPGSIYNALGLNLKLVQGDDFPAQVKRYLSGDSPYLRAELRMIGLASEVLSADPRTKPVVITQLTWSAGDHMVARSHLRTLTDLRGRKIALQQNGPHRVRVVLAKDVPVISDLLILCLIRRKDAETSLDGIDSKFQADQRPLAERALKWYGQTVNLYPAMFNLMAKLVLLARAHGAVPVDGEFDRLAQAVDGDLATGHSITVSGDIACHAASVDEVLSELMR